jgi:hypothetical protein
MVNSINIFVYLRMFFFYPNQRNLKQLKNIANRMIIEMIKNNLQYIQYSNHNILRIEFLYIFTKMKYRTYLSFQYVYYIERFTSFISCLYKRLLDRKHQKWRNRSDWAHQTYRNVYRFFRNYLQLVYWTHFYFLNRFTIKKHLIIPASPSSRRRISQQE